MGDGEWAGRQLQGALCQCMSAAHHPPGGGVAAPLCLADHPLLPGHPGALHSQVVIRVRPPLAREMQGYQAYQCTSMVDARSGQLITISENLPAVLSGTAAQDGLMYATYRFTFDHVYDQDSTQQEVYDQSARPLVLSALQGYNAAIIAYGQTGTGKTYTMEGELEGSLRGVIPRSVEDLFAAIENDPEPSATKYLVRASYLQIYNEASRAPTAEAEIRAACHYCAVVPVFPPFSIRYPTTLPPALPCHPPYSANDPHHHPHR